MTKLRPSWPFSTRRSAARKETRKSRRRIWAQERGVGSGRGRFEPRLRPPPPLRVLTGLPVEGAVELVDRGRDLEPGLQDGLLPLQAHVLGPLDESAEVALGLDVLPDAEVARALLEQRVHHPLHLRLLDGQGRRSHLLPLLLALKGKEDEEDIKWSCRRTQFKLFSPSSGPW